MIDDGSKMYYISFVKSKLFIDNCVEVVLVDYYFSQCNLMLVDC